MLPYLLPLFLLELAVASVLPQETISGFPNCDCTGTRIRTNVSVFYDYICGDKRLGPRILPEKLPAGTVMANYDRFGGLSPDQFLEKWWNETANNWIYPNLEGFLLDTEGKPMNASLILEPGMLVDRFGYATGKRIYLSTCTIKS